MKRQEVLTLSVVLALMTGSTAAPAAVFPASVDIKPGPAILNDPPPRAPHFENTGIWQAPPILVSGASAYRKGEFLYQDWIYDDRGALTSAPASLARSGRYTYPTTVSSYFENLADIVEVRLKTTSSDTAFRVTYNSMSDPALVGTTIALGGTAGVRRTVPFGANAVMPADIFITLRGSSAVITDAATGNQLATVNTSVDTDRRQIEVRVPFGLYDPRGNSAVRVAAAVGLWDSNANAYSIPRTTATATTPGGAGTLVNPPAFFNVAYRYTEPNPAVAGYTAWRDGVQASTLAAVVTVNGVQTHDLSLFSATVDFVKLATGVDDDMPGTATGVPVAGFTNRILSSRFETMQGVGNPAAADLQLHKPFGCTPTSLRSADNATSCVPSFAGRLQPYSLYIPLKVPPSTGYGLISDLHGGGDNYNKNSVTAERSVQLSEAGQGSLVFIGEARGGRYYWGGQAGADTWEVIADIKRNFKINPDKIVAGGISHGGNGSWVQALSFPDVYAAVIPHVPCVSGGTGYNGSNAPGGAGTFAWQQIDSLRNLPVIVSAGEADTTCAWAGAMGNQAIRAKLDALEYAYEFWSFPGMGHQFAMQPCNNISPKPCAYSHLADFLENLENQGKLMRVVDPPRVTLAVSDQRNEPLFGFEADHAYWISGVKIRDVSTNYAKVDVKSFAFGLDDPIPNATVKTLNTDYATGQNISYHNYNKWVRTLNPPVPTTPQDRIDVVATNIKRVVIDPIRAKISCNAIVNVQSDGPISVAIHGCMAGDVDLDDAVGCSDLVAARTAMGKRTGQPLFNIRADMDNNGLIDIRDIAMIARLVPAGSVCQ